MNFKERVLLLVKEKTNGVKHAFEKAVGLSNGSINKMGDKPQFETVVRIIERFPDINRNWLIDGYGKMYVDEKLEDVSSNYEVRFKKVEASIADPANVMMVPLVHQYAQAGYLCGFGDPEFIESLPKVPFHVDHNGKGNYMCFEVRGESMFDGSYNSYMEGDLVLCREIPRHYWKFKLHISKWNFVIIHRNEGVLIKQITKHDIDNGEITIHSLNPEYEDKVLKLDEIDKLFNVIKFERG